MTSDFDEQNYREARLFLDVLCDGFAEQLKDCIRPSDASDILKAMNALLPNAIARAEAAEENRPKRVHRRVRRTPEGESFGEVQ